MVQCVFFAVKQNGEALTSNLSAKRKHNNDDDDDSDDDNNDGDGHIELRMYIVCI